MFLRYKQLMVFLRDNSQETYVEITNIYSEIMDKIYYQLFKTYVIESAKLVEERITKNDLIIIDDQQMKMTRMDSQGNNQVATEGSASQR